MILPYKYTMFGFGLFLTQYGGLSLATIKPYWMAQSKLQFDGFIPSLWRGQEDTGKAPATSFQMQENYNGAAATAADQFGGQTAF